MARQSDESDTVRASTLARELRVTLGRLVRRLREQTRAGDLTSSQTAVLSRLERDGPATVTSLAKAEGMRPQSMGAVVAALEIAGLVRGDPDPADGRQTLLSLTEASRALITASRTAREDWLLQAIRTKLASREQHDLAAGIELLKRLVDP